MPDRPVPPPRAAEGLVYTPQPDPGWSLAGPERRAAREEAAALRAERDRASRLLDDEGTARVVAAADRLRALETAQNHAIAAELRRIAADGTGWAIGTHLLARAAELEAAEPAAAQPQADAWRVAVEVPLDAPGRDALFAAVSRAVADWEPEQRDGWDACVTAQPVATDPAEAVADLGLTGTWDAPGSRLGPIQGTVGCGGPLRQQVAADLDALLHAVRLAAYRATANGATPAQVRQAASEGAALARREVGP